MVRRAPGSSTWSTSTARATARRAACTTHSPETDLLRREIVDFESARGRKVFIRLVDNTNEGPVGYIAFDDFVFHDGQPSFAVEEADHQRQRTSPVLWDFSPIPLHLRPFRT